VYLELIRNSCFMKSRNPKKKNLGLRDKNLRSVSTEKPSTPSLGDSSPDPFHIIFPIDEMIMSVMSMEDTP
jgi:hypothetical protein